jgi:hypothetical protein
MLQIAGGILLAIVAIFALGFGALFVFSAAIRERPGKTPEQLAVEYAAWLRRRRLAYRIVFGVLSIWALAVVAVFVFS